MEIKMIAWDMKRILKEVKKNREQKVFVDPRYVLLQKEEHIKKGGKCYEIC